MGKDVLTATHLSRDIRRLVDEVAKAQGLTVSEYLRRLIIDDLERRSLISSRIEKIKEEIKNGNSI